MKFRYSIISFLLLCSCGKKPKLPVVVIGHAGMGLNFIGSIYHANSKEAINLAIETPNCDGVEIDVRLAADGTLWLSHDPLLETETNASGCVENKKVVDLEEISFKSLNNEKLVQLQQVEKLVSGSGLIFLDIKHSNSCFNSTLDVNLFLKALNNWKIIVSDQSRIRILLNNPDWIAPFLAADYAVLFSSDDQTRIRKLNDQFTGLLGFISKNKSRSKREVQEILSWGKEIHLFEVRSPKALREVRKKEPTGVISDDVQGAILEFK